MRPSVQVLPGRQVLTADLLQDTEGRAVLYITHQPDGLGQIDQIVVLDHGRVAERGSHQQLRHAGGRPPPLTPAELRLLPYLQTHLTADRLFVSSHTVKTQVKSIYRKLGVSSRNDAV